MTDEFQPQRLSDRILSALELSIEQGDLTISEFLRKALDLSMTRNAGGGAFIEKRDYPDVIQRAMEDLHNLEKDK